HFPNLNTSRPRNSLPTTKDNRQDTNNVQLHILCHLNGTIVPNLLHNLPLIRIQCLIELVTVLYVKLFLELNTSSVLVSLNITRTETLNKPLFAAGPKLPSVSPRIYSTVIPKKSVFRGEENPVYKVKKSPEIGRLIKNSRTSHRKNILYATEVSELLRLMEAYCTTNTPSSRNLVREVFDITLTDVALIICIDNVSNALIGTRLLLLDIVGLINNDSVSPEILNKLYESLVLTPSLVVTKKKPLRLSLKHLKEVI